MASGGFAESARQFCSSYLHNSLSLSRAGSDRTDWRENDKKSLPKKVQIAQKHEIGYTYKQRDIYHDVRVSIPTQVDHSNLCTAAAAAAPEFPPNDKQPSSMQARQYQPMSTYQMDNNGETLTRKKETPRPPAPALPTSNSQILHSMQQATWQMPKGKIRNMGPQSGLLNTTLNSRVGEILYTFASSKAWRSCVSSPVQSCRMNP